MVFITPTAPMNIAKREIAQLAVSIKLHPWFILSDDEAAVVVESWLG